MSVDLSTCTTMKCYTCAMDIENDDYSAHSYFHQQQDQKIQALLNEQEAIKSRVDMLFNDMVRIQIAITAIEKVIGTTGNFRFVEVENYSDNDPF